MSVARLPEPAGGGRALAWSQIPARSRPGSPLRRETKRGSDSPPPAGAPIRNRSVSPVGGAPRRSDAARSSFLLGARDAPVPRRALVRLLIGFLMTPSVTVIKPRRAANYRAQTTLPAARTDAPNNAQGQLLNNSASYLFTHESSSVASSSWRGAHQYIKNGRRPRKLISGTSAEYRASYREISRDIERERQRERWREGKIWGIVHHRGNKGGRRIDWPQLAGAVINAARQTAARRPPAVVLCARIDRDAASL